MLLLVLLFLTILFAYVFYILIVVISESVTHLTLYHFLIPNNWPIEIDPIFGEYFWEKFQKVFIWNLLLAIVLMPNFFIIFDPKLSFPSKGMTEADFAFILALCLIPAFLLSLRILTNPTKKGFQFLEMIHLNIRIKEIDTIKRIKERMASFFSSFIIVNIIILIVYIIYEIFKSGSKMDISRFFPSLSWEIVLILILIEIVIIFLTTLFGEIYLKHMIPIDQE